MKKFKKWLMLSFAALLVSATSLISSAATPQKTYSSVDLFEQATSIKGLQGTGNSSVYGGINHTLGNHKLNDVIFESETYGCVKYEYGGETFYFDSDPLGEASYYVWAAKQSNMTVSVVFLLEYSAQSAFLIDPASCVPGYRFYAPNTDMNTYGGRAIRAYWHYLMEYLIDNGLHIDNFILGNEVNMPTQWHYSASVDPGVVANKYADAFYVMYSAIREYSDIPRCSVSLDHSWQHNDEGRGIMAKTFLHYFNDRLAGYQSGIDWCVSTHLYPAILFETDLWNGSTLIQKDLSPSHAGAEFVDGSNLWVMTSYIQNTWGEQHRVMLTEQGFTDYKGHAAQTACLAYTYYAALYDPMVDCFLITTGNHGDKLNFDLNSTAAEVFTKIGNRNATDEKWIAYVCLPTIGVSSWADIIPNYGADYRKPGIYGAQVELIESDDLKVTVNLNVDRKGFDALEYSWLIYEASTGMWGMGQDWTDNAATFTWYPPAADDYMIMGKVRIKGTEEEFTSFITYKQEHDPNSIYIKGKCQMPYEGGGYLIGCETNCNPDQKLRYELLILDCTLLAQGKDAWIWTTGQCGVSDGNAFWAVWQPQYGYYWTLFRVFDENGNMIDEECYGFENIC